MLPPALQGLAYQVPFLLLGVGVGVFAVLGDRRRRGGGLCAAALLVAYFPIAYGWNLLILYQMVEIGSSVHPVLMTVRTIVGALLLGGAALALVLTAARRDTSATASPVGPAWHHHQGGPGPVHPPPSGEWNHTPTGHTPPHQPWRGQIPPP
ncbi:hypothetical protein J4H86_04100 [Spiractinospora alimapuensis]|uniref:hypothetical protein n=1 Tax=Spiractinospora alimapuensis TaxID=2820884 RepID=UPI001F28044D|nr:hypothetical protein [Spiractinospora alimapuensis]QVQ53000.1 hypothetical protein J4H86_04100 [Spiractinospora alimapuensis]